MKDVVIHNWDELQHVIFKGAWDPNLMRYRTNFIYRGLNDASVSGWVPKLNRYCGHKLELEESLIRNFRKYAYAEMGTYNGFWTTITLGQHYGLPTRLLDWSYSPLVAAHFATEDLDMTDGSSFIACESEAYSAEECKEYTHLSSCTKEKALRIGNKGTEVSHCTNAHEYE